MVIFVKHEAAKNVAFFLAFPLGIFGRKFHVLKKEFSLIQKEKNESWKHLLHLLSL